VSVVREEDVEESQTDWRSNKRGISNRWGKEGSQSKKGTTKKKGGTKETRWVVLELVKKGRGGKKN